ncbi:MAG: hypothetical protein FJW39_00520 [Acidobacteria bacterium]|nr:hypothetical protein [Acidobacteriota bacterium]
MSWGSVLLGCAAVAGAWIVLKILRVRQWARMFGAGADAAAKGNLAEALRLFEMADQDASRHRGTVANTQQRMARDAMATVAFRMGNLDRSAALLFDLLQRHNASP